MRKRKRVMVVVGIMASVIGAVVVALWWHVGAFSGAASWEVATGWEAIPVAARATAAVPEVQWLGHAGFAVETAGQRLLLDPNLSGRCTVSQRRWVAPVDAGDVGAVDAVLISHAHRDHLDPATLAGLQSVGTVVVPAGAEQWLPDRLRRRALSVRPGEIVHLGKLELVVLEAQHNGHRDHPFGSEIEACSYLLRGGRSTIYWAGDTGMGAHFAAIGERYRPDVAILPIGAFRPRWPLAHYHLSPEEAVTAARELGVERVVPGHFGTFVLSLDDCDEALPRFAAATAAVGLDWAMPAIFSGFEDNAATMVAVATNREKED